MKSSQYKAPSDVGVESMRVARRISVFVKSTVLLHGTSETILSTRRTNSKGSRGTPPMLLCLNKSIFSPSKISKAELGDLPAFTAFIVLMSSSRSPTPAGCECRIAANNVSLVDLRLTAAKRLLTSAGTAAQTNRKRAASTSLSGEGVATMYVL
jgi:hypothetical protein